MFEREVTLSITHFTHAYHNHKNITRILTLEHRYYNAFETSNQGIEISKSTIEIGCGGCDLAFEVKTMIIKFN